MLDILSILAEVIYQLLEDHLRAQQTRPAEHDDGWDGWDIQSDTSESADSSGWIDLTSDDDHFSISDSEDDFDTNNAQTLQGQDRVSSLATAKVSNIFTS